MGYTDQGPLCLKLPPRTSGHSRAFLVPAEQYSSFGVGSIVASIVGPDAIMHWSSGNPGFREPDVSKHWA